MKELDTIFPIDNGERVVCLAGVGLASLQQFVQEQFPDRESHSILGSTFLNPTTAAGVAFGSGGTQMRKGPAFTERALYLKVDCDKYGKSSVKVINTLGVKGLDGEEGEFESHIRHDGVIRTLDTYISSVKAGVTHIMKKSNDTHGKKPASDTEYKTRLCKHGKEVNRYNADLKGCDCNRSEGKVLILASVHDTFPKPSKAKTFWISFDSFETALQFRRKVCLDNPNDLPVSMEYMDRDSFDVIDCSGRVLGNTIKAVGTSSPLVRSLWNFKIWMEAFNVRGASSKYRPCFRASIFVKCTSLTSTTIAIGDRILYWLNPIMPSILPGPIMKMGKEKNHHVAMTVGEFDDGSLDRFMERLGEFQKHNGSSISVHECQSKSEESSLSAFRFVAAPAFRTYCVGNGMQGFSVDYALPRDGGEAPPLQSETPVKRMRYSHFGCNVVHEDVAFPAGVDVESIKYELKKSVEHNCHGRLPAEHGHGTEYHAPETTQKRWMKMDPLNVMNPGVGGLPSTYRYRTD
jgi:D-lactate dehydrogenase